MADTLIEGVAKTCASTVRRGLARMVNFRHDGAAFAMTAVVDGRISSFVLDQFLGAMKALGMRNRFLTKQSFVLTLLAVCVVTPAAYAQQPAAPGSPAQPAAQ